MDKSKINNEISSLKISVLIFCCDIREQVINTLESLKHEYQNFDPNLYEVLILENPSENNLSQKEILNLPDNFFYNLNTYKKSSTESLNKLSEQAKGDYLLIIPDGAEILSKRVLNYCYQATKISSKCIVAFHSYNLGFSRHFMSKREEDHSKKIEKEFLNETLPNNPDNLLNNASWSSSSSSGSFYQMAESNCLLLTKQLWNKIDGFDQRLDSIEEGFANLDLYNRVLENKDHNLFFVLGEGTFNQLNSKKSKKFSEKNFEKCKSEYFEITKKKLTLSKRKDFDLLGRVYPSSLKLLKQSLISTISNYSRIRPQNIQSNIRSVIQSTYEEVKLASHDFIFVLSMHRSKSSYFARKILEAKQTFIPGSIMAGKSLSNPKGHFEPLDIVTYHNNILDELAHGWRSISTIDFDKVPNEKKLIFKENLQKILKWGIKQNHDVKKSILIKDPRICRLWPLWQEIIIKENLSFKKIILIDNPEKISKSLFKRDGLNIGLGKLLWARYTYDCLVSSTKSDLILDLNISNLDSLNKNINNYLDCHINFDDFIFQEKIIGNSKIDIIYNEFKKHLDKTILKDELGKFLNFIDLNPDFFNFVDVQNREIF